MGRTERILTAAILLFAGWMVVHPLGIASDDAYRDNDWMTDRTFDVLARDALLTHHQLPLRSHQLGGGYPTIGHPFDGTLSPTLLPTLVFGDVIGVKIVIALLLLLGSWGMWGLARGWLGVGKPVAALAVLAFAFAGWVPSMLLVGFYPQALYLVAPALLRLLWVDVEQRPRRSILLAGGVLYLLLAQAGNAALAVAWFVALATWLKTAADEHPALVVPALLAWAAVAGPLAVSRELEGHPALIGVGAVVAAGLVLGIPKMRAAAKAMGPHAARGLAVGAIAIVLGLGKIVAVSDLLDRGEYVHELSWGYELWFPRLPHGEPDGRVFRMPGFDPPPYADPDFFMGLDELAEGLHGRVPREGEYSPFPPPSGAGPMEERPFGIAEREYMWIGLTAPVALLALVGLGAGRRRAVLATSGACVAGVCLGPHLLPDLHFLLVKGLPGFDSIVQPIKYFGFFLVPVGALAAAGVYDRWAPADPRAAYGIVAALAAWPFVQSGTALMERFEHPVDVEREASFSQLVHVGHPDWVAEEPVEIERWGREWGLRELARPAGFREYEIVKRGLGIVDWYGTVELPERAVPKTYVTPSGETLANPRYEGAEVRVGGGEGTVESWDIGPTTLRATVTTTGDARVTFNQSWMEEFVSNTGEVRDDAGLVAVDLSGAGTHDVEVVWRPGRILAAIGASLVAAVAWLLLLIADVRRAS